MIGAPHFYYVCATGRFFDSRYSVFGHTHIGAEDRFDDDAFGGIGNIIFTYLFLGQFGESNERQYGNANLRVIVFVVTRHDGLRNERRREASSDTSIGVPSKVEPQLCL